LVWWGCSVGGLNRFDPVSGRCAVFKEAQGLPNNVVYGIQPDSRGRLWLSTNRGLAQFDPAGRTCRNYDLDDGLQSNQFFWGASWRCRNGLLIFGGINGFNLFWPEQIVDSTFMPPLVLTNFKLFNEPYPLPTEVSETQHITLSHRQNFIAFEFAALDFTEPRKNRYAYRLEGLNRGWIEVGNEHQASYTNLDPGEYLFRVKGTNSDGVWNEAGLTIRVSIVPPPWRTWWAYLAYTVTLGGALIAFYRIKSRSQRLKSERQMAERLRDLNLALTSTLDIDQVTHRLLDNLIRTVPFDSGQALVIVDGRLSVRARRGEEGPPAAESWNSAFIREGLFAELSRTRLPLIVADIRPDKRFDWTAAAGHYRSWLGIPLVYRDRVIGAVSLFGRLPGAFGGREADIASAFAAPAGFAFENARLFSEVKNLAVTDELTGLFNRRHFFELAENEYRRALRYNRPLSAIMVDIDHFKKLNDTYGHPFGDQVLRHVGQFFRRNLWETDIIGRYGGEEVLVLLTETALPEALLVAERLRRRFAEGAMPIEQLGPLAVTVSLGVSTLVEEDEGLEALFARADAAMYQAKRRGRDKVVSVRRDLVFQELSQSGSWVSINPDETLSENK